MGLHLSDSYIEDFDSCVGAPILTYLDCPYGPRCFSYPQFLLNGKELFYIENSAFPEVGCLPMTVQGTTPTEMKKDFGDLVVMTVNAKPRENDNYESGSEQHVFNSIYDPTYKGSNPAIQFASLSQHRLSSQLMQVLEIQEDRVDFAKVKSAKVHIFDDQSIPQTRTVVIAQVENGNKKFFGPFSFTIGEGNEVSLLGSSDHDFYIAGFNEDSFDFLIDVADSEGAIAAQFIDSEEFAEKFESTNEKFDWIPDQDLIDVMGRVGRSSKNLGLTRKKLQAFKRDIAEYQSTSEQVSITPERRRRMSDLVSNYEDWQDLSEEARSEKIENADAAQLAEFVLSDEHFSEFYNKVIEHEGLKESVEQHKADYRHEENEAKKQLQDVKDELNAYQSEAEAKKQELLAEIEEEAKGKREEITKLQERIDGLAQEKARLEGEKTELEEDKVLVQRQIRKTVQEMSDDISVSKKILENEMIKQIVTSINAKDMKDEGQSPFKSSPAILLRDSEDEMTDYQVLNSLHHTISDTAGRELEFNQVANILICLQQGYVTTFAGLPGTGKTSLAGILAGALGLRNIENPRYSEVSVEKGWTSYKDFIGYYNPFTSSLEKSNIGAFEAFERLDAERNKGASSVSVPYIFLLDEANLSSMEHYWSPFLKACDSFRNGAFSVPLGGSYSFRVPEYVRFIATVNFDHTTEELSPRFLDRSWVITLDPDSSIFEDDKFGYEFDASTIVPYSYGKLESVFGAPQESRMGNESRVKLKEIIGLCEDSHFPVSPRSQKMMRDYICVAEKLMDKSSTQTALAPVDFAFSQKVLPQLSGTEERVSDLLQKLNAVAGLPETKKRTQHMLEAGSENGYYQYFG